MSISTIVVGVDGSEGAAQALTWLADLAAPLGATVVAVHVFEPLAHLGDQDPPYDFAVVERRVRARFETAWITPLTEAGVHTETRLMHGSPYGCLLDAAEDTGADLIVVGARGLGVFRGLALGSTSNKVVHLAKVPVVVVPPVD
jgi:nucleotide-binding universal stress UspA family protein